MKKNFIDIVGSGEQKEHSITNAVELTRSEMKKILGGVDGGDGGGVGGGGICNTGSCSVAIPNGSGGYNTEGGTCKSGNHDTILGENTGIHCWCASPNHPNWTELQNGATSVCGSGSWWG